MVVVVVVVVVKGVRITVSDKERSLLMEIHINIFIRERM